MKTGNLRFFAEEKEREQYDNAISGNRERGNTRA